ncbi:MAG TPA: hypothetical protein VK788_23750 [Terriglobales bacterium]|nr:hypothetical protein [Terriglobales bacterium]
MALRKQPYAVRVQPPGHRKLPTPCAATGARESPGAAAVPAEVAAPFVDVSALAAVAAVEPGVEDRTLETGAADITLDTGAEDMTLETGFEDVTVESAFAGVRTVWDEAGVTAVPATGAVWLVLVVVVAVFAEAGWAATFFAGTGFTGTGVVCAPAVKHAIRVIAPTATAKWFIGCVGFKRVIALLLLEMSGGTRGPRLAGL